MKKLIVALCVSLFSFGASAQGLTFLTDMTFEQALAAAQKSDKYLLLDVYATWCGPCKKLSAETFPSKIVGDKLNSKFVGFKVDAEKGEGVTIAKNYKVRAYPTLIIFSEGKEIARMEGAPFVPEEFVKAVMDKVAKATVK